MVSGVRRLKKLCFIMGLSLSTAIGASVQILDFDDPISAQDAINRINAGQWLSVKDVEEEINFEDPNNRDAILYLLIAREGSDYYAQEIIERGLSESANFVALYNLGTYYAQNNDFAEANKYWSLASDAGSSQAAYRLQKYALAANQGHAKAQYRLSEFVVGDDEKAEYYLMMSAKQGYAKAQRDLAHLYAGHGLYVNAIKYWTQSAKAGDNESLYYLGQSYKHGRGVEKSLEQALYYYELAADDGFTQAIYQQAKLLEETDREQAIELFELAGDEGHVSSLKRLSMLKDNKGEYLERISKLSGDISPLEIAIQYETESNEDKAFEHYDKAMRAGVKAAEVPYYELAVKRGDETAKLPLARIYNRQGRYEDTYNLIGYHLSPEHVAQLYYNDALRSGDVKRFQDAADLGHIQAAYRAGELLEQQRNYLLAERYYRLASRTQERCDLNAWRATAKMWQMSCWRKVFS